MSVLPFALLVLLILNPALGSVIATVNGVSISEADLNRQMERDHQSGKSENRTQTLNRLILFELANQKANEKGLTKNPEFTHKVKKLAYQEFINHALQRHRASFQPSLSELKAKYAEAPLLRLRHLALFAKDAEQRDSAEKTLSRIQAELKAGTSFQSLILRYSQDPAARFLGGEADFHGPHSLDSRFYDIVKKLKINEITSPFTVDNVIHLFQLAETKTFAQAPESYKQLLRGQVVSERKENFLNELFANLKNNAKIKMINKEIL